MSQYAQPGGYSPAGYPPPPGGGGYYPPPPGQGGGYGGPPLANVGPLRPPPSTTSAPPGEGMHADTNPRAPCPTIWVYGNKGTSQAPKFTFMPCKFRWIEYKCDIHISMAFCTAMFQCVVPLPKGQKSAAIFQLPMANHGTVTEVFVQNETRNSVFVTAVVPTEQTKGMKSASKDKSKTDDTTPAEDPNMVQVKLPSVNSGDVLAVRVQWFYPLEFKEGRYKLTMPTRLFPDSLDTETGATSASKAINIHVNINTGNPGRVPWRDNSHPMTIVREFDGKVELKADSDKAWPNVDFSLAYMVWNDAILASLNVQLPGTKSVDRRGTFVLSIAPPNPKAIPSAPRSVIFLLDRSGSMAGDPLDYAKRSLQMGLTLLTERDFFNVITYDHQQMVFANTLVQATPQNLHQAQDWVGRVLSGGMTDILTPLIMASDMMAVVQGGIPYIFLLTDGKVEDEKEICNWSLSLPNDPRFQGRQSPRISTFAIGPYCNHVFLKQLACMARGLSDVALRPDQIQQSMERMLLASEKPVLFDVGLGISGLKDLELYPFPVPDLFCGQPLVISGKFTGDFPGNIGIVGKLANGAQWTQTVETRMNADIPLEKVFVRQQLDLLTAKAWLTDDKVLIQKVIDISVKNNVPSAHTTMIGFEVTPSKYAEFQKAQNSGKGMSAGKITAIAVGGAVGIGIVGIAVLSFGDLGATMSNLPVGDALGGAMSGLGDVMGTVGDGLGDMVEGVGECMGECCGDMADTCGGIFGGCGDCFSTIGDGIGDCCSGVASCVGGVFGGN